MTNLKFIATSTLSRIANAIREKDPDLGDPNMTPLQMPHYINRMNLHGYTFEDGEGGAALNLGANLRAKFQNNALRMYSVISNQVTDMQQAFNNCRNLVGEPMCNNSVIYGYQMYRDCWNLTGSPSRSNQIQSLQNMCQSYYNCINITGNASIGQNVTDASLGYYNCSNLDGIVDAPDVGNVVNLRQTFFNCVNLGGLIPNINTAKCLDTYQAFTNCQNIGGSPICGSAVTDMTSMYENCYNISGRGCCGPNVTIMNRAFYDCYNIEGPSVIGNKVTTAHDVYRNCHGIYDAIMPNSITRIDNGFRDCWNLGRSYMSQNCQIWINLYNNCQNLTGSIIAGKETQYTQGSFHNCFRLQGVYIIANANGSSSIMNVTRSADAFNRMEIDDPKKLSRLNVVFTQKVTMQKLAVESVTGCEMSAVETIPEDSDRTISLPLTYVNGNVYGYKNYTCVSTQYNKEYNLYFYSLN